MAIARFYPFVTMEVPGGVAQMRLDGARPGPWMWLFVVTSIEDAQQQFHRTICELPAMRRWLLNGMAAGHLWLAITMNDCTTTFACSYSDEGWGGDLHVVHGEA